jgi:hypothetical protein
MNLTLPHTFHDGSVASHSIEIALRDKPLKTANVGFGLDKDNIVSLFRLAGIPIVAIWRLPNGYFSFQDGEDEKTTYENAVYREYRPAWLVKVLCGLIEITPQKRVVDIDWSKTPVRFDRDKGITNDETTKSAMGVHAWSVEKVLEYLKLLAPELEKQPNIWPMVNA